MLVWTNNTYGHVALITRVGGGTLDIIEQNVTGSGATTLAYNGASVGSRWGSWVPAGWAHAKANGGGGGGISWDCNKSAYNGNQYWTCSGGHLYKCLSGVPQRQVCAAGCNGGCGLPRHITQTGYAVSHRHDSSRPPPLSG